MTRFNFDLSDPNPFSTKHPLSPDDITYLKDCFSLIAEYEQNIPDNVFSDMADIEKQFNKDYRLSEKQVDYVKNVCDQYCIEQDEDEFSEEDFRNYD